MNALRTLVVIAIWLCIALGCKGGSAVAGTYGLQQEGAGFGPGAEMTDLELHPDGKFDITLGKLTLASGTWKEENGKVNLSGGGQNLGTSYKIDDGKLIPIINGKEVTFWRFVRK